MAGCPVPRRADQLRARQSQASRAGDSRRGQPARRWFGASHSRLDRGTVHRPRGVAAVRPDPGSATCRPSSSPRRVPSHRSSACRTTTTLRPGTTANSSIAAHGKALHTPPSFPSEGLPRCSQRCSTRSPLDSVHRPGRSRWHGYCSTPPRSCSSQALPPWRTCARISPLPTSGCRPTRSTNSTGSALADVCCDSMRSTARSSIWKTSRPGARSTSQQGAERRQAMSYSISTLLTRNLHDVFGENDPARRRAAIDEIFTEDCVFYEPRGVYRGRDEIDRVAGAIKATHPDFRYQPIAGPEELGNGGPVRWVSRRRGVAPAYAGTDFIIARDGRIAAVYLFFDKLP